MNNPRIVEKLTETLRNSHKEEIVEHTRQRDNLQRIIKSCDRIIEGAYKDKLRGEMSPELCEKAMSDATTEKESAISALQSLSETRTAYYEAGLAIHELAVHIKDLYNSEHITKDEKRLLLSHLFSNIKLLTGTKNVDAKYTPGFQFLADWAPKLNKNFEPTKNPSVNGAFSMVSNQKSEPIVPSANNNFEPKEVLILPNDLSDSQSNHEVCSRIKTLANF